MAKKKKRSKKPTPSAPKKTEPKIPEKKSEKPPEKEAPAKKTKRKIAPTIEAPSVLIPAVVAFVLFLLSYILAKYDTFMFGREMDYYAMMVTGFSVVLFAVLVPIYRNRRQLTTGFAKATIYGVSAFSLLACGYSIFTGVDFGETLAQGDVMVGEKVAFEVPGKHYQIFLRGFFPEPEAEEQEQQATPAEQEPAAATPEQEQPATEEQPGEQEATTEQTPEQTDQKDKKPKATKPRVYKLTGNYSIRVSNADTGEVIQDFTGTFESKRTRRRVSKKGRDYVEVLKTNSLKDLNLPRSGKYQIHIITLGDELAKKVEFSVYHQRQMPSVLALIGILVAFILGFVDYLIKPLRVDSYFAIATGVAFGFTSYFSIDTNPINQFGTMAIDLLVGGVMGGGVAYLVYMLGTKVYENIARRYKLSLG